MSDRPPVNVPLPVQGEFDAANAALADALRKSFNLLKWLMIIVVVLYLFSGLFRVRPGEVGYILRMGQVVTPAGLEPGWHWSWPFPIDEAKTMSLARDMTVPAPFMFMLSEEQRLSGIQPGGSAFLRPGRDWYLLTGDLNILHAELKARYIISDPIEYLTNVYDVSPNDDNPPEYELLVNALSTAAIETASQRQVDEVYRDQSGYLAAVADRMNQRLSDLDKAGRPVGIKVRQVFATDFKGYEGIIPPLAVLQEFLNVTAAEQNKGTALAEAKGKAATVLINAAGPHYAELADAIDAEFVGQHENSPNLDALRKRTDDLLRSDRISGAARSIIKTAEYTREQIVTAAGADASQLQGFADQYRKNPDMLFSRLRLSMMQRLLSNPNVNTTWFPASLREMRVLVPRDLGEQTRAAQVKKMHEAEHSRRGMIAPGSATVGKLRFQAN